MKQFLLQSTRLLCTLLVATCMHAQAHDCDWPFKTEVTIANSSAVPLTNYQTRIDITGADLNPGYDWSAAGADLRVLDSDDTTELTYFLESWDQGAQTATVWVTVPALSASGSRTVYLVYGNGRVPDDSAATLTFGAPGIKFHTKQTSVDPTNRAQAEAAFANATPAAGYGCTFITNFTGITNRNQFAPPNRDSNITFFSESWFEVSSGEAGVWSFRYGADFGRGGGLYVDDIALEEQWNDDLWWANNWGAANEVLEGSINLTEGFHSLRILGFEGCCDGGVTVQFRKPGGSYQALTTANLDFRSRQCNASEPTVTFGAQSFCGAAMNVNKSIQAVGGVANMAVTPNANPGDIITYEVTVQSLGPGPASNVLVSDALNPFTPLSLDAFGAGVVFDCVSGCGTGMGDAQLGTPEYSNDDGVTWTYVPVSGADGAPAGFDGAITDWRLPIENMIYGGEDVVVRFEAVVR